MMAGRRSVGLALYRWLIRLLPESVRSDFAEEMIQTVRLRRRTLRRSPRVGTFWCREIYGATRAIYSAWRDVRRDLRTGSARDRWWMGWWSDVRLVIRSVVRRPRFFASAVIILALGIGANGAMLGVSWTSFYAPSAFPEGEQLVRVFHDDDLTFGVSLNELLDYRASSALLTDVAGWRLQSTTYNRIDDPKRVTGLSVTPNLLAVLGRAPLLGRSFDTDGWDREIILTHNFWKVEFGEDSAVIGRSISIDDTPHSVVGVIPRDVVFPEDGVDYMVSINWDAPRPAGRGGTFVDVIARVERDVTLQAAETELGIIASRFRTQFASEYSGEPDITVRLVQLRTHQVGQFRVLLIALTAAGLIAFLAACANIATLLVGEIEGRAVEIATRRALGASNRDLARWYGLQGALLAFAGAVGGIIVSMWVSQTVGQVVPVDVARVDVVGIALAVGTVSLVAVMLLFAAPLPFVYRTSVNLSVLRSPLLRHGTLGRAFLTGQIAFALTLVSAAVLLYATVQNLTSVDLGYRVDDVITARVTLPASRYASPVASSDFFSRLQERLVADPMVLNAGLVSGLPLGGDASGGDVYLEAISGDSAVDVVSQRLVSSNYFDVMAIPLLTGRLFRESDDDNAGRVVLIDRTFAERFFGEPNRAVGERLRSFFGGPSWNVIVGVVGTVRHSGPRSAAVPHVYYPVTQRPTRGAFVVVHASGRPDIVAMRLRGHVSAVDPTVPMYDIQPMAQRFKASIIQSRLALRLFTLLACLTMILVGVGVYASVSLAHARRRRDIGICRALGARSSAILWTTARLEIRAVWIGVMGGAAGAWAMDRALQGLAFGISVGDVRVLGFSMLVLASVTGLALVIPTRSAIDRESIATVLRS